MSQAIQQSEIFRRHIARLRSSLAAHSPETICDFITTHTFLRGQRFSFAGHEYQREILNDPAQNIVITKSAQIGISEMSARLAVARGVLINGFSTIYTLPSATAARDFMRDRINPIIDSSEYLRELEGSTVDNMGAKKFGDSFLYLKGCQVDRQAISVPADMLINDEVNNSDQNVMTLFESRLIHSPYAMTIKLSTPTIPDFGIDLAFKQSKRKFNFARCPSCHDWFLPEYFHHVRVPGWKKELEEISKRDFADPSFRWREAYVECPHCRRPVDLREAERNRVVENPDTAFLDSGYRISPFDCPTIIQPSALVKSSVEYKRPVDFYNQRLGLSLADKESALAREELEAIIVSHVELGSHSCVIGLDMGNTCWITVMAVGVTGQMLIVHVEPVPLHKVVERTQELSRIHKVRMIVVDRGPMTEAVYQIQQKMRNSFAAVFVQTKGVELFKVTDREGDAEKGVEDMRQVNIAKDSCMDLIMAMIRNHEIQKISCQYDDLWIEHLTDNKRVHIFKNEELVLTWVKTQGLDHWHMALVYALVASRILGVVAGCETPLPLAMTMRIQKPKDERFPK